MSSESELSTHSRGDPLITMTWRLTAAFIVMTVVTVVTAEDLDLVYAVLCVLTFAIGVALFLLGFWNGVQRSRTDEVTLPGLLAASRSHVPARSRNLLWGAVTIQVVVAVVAASLRPFTQQAFGLLVPMFGIGVASLWGSRRAEFFERT